VTNTFGGQTHMKSNERSDVYAVVVVDMWSENGEGGRQVRLNMSKAALLEFCEVVAEEEEIGDPRVKPRCACSFPKT